MSNTSSFPDSALSGPTPTSDLHEIVRRRAEEIYVQGGRIPGHDLENWAQAENEILRNAERSPRQMAIVIKVNGVQYVGEYSAESSDGYRPGEFGPGTPVPVRFHDGKMSVKRPNGKELETRIVKKLG